MALRNPDGSRYQVSGSLQQFDPASPDHCLFNQWDAEVIKIGGSPIFYYEVFIQTQTLDPIHREDRGKIWSSHPIQLYAHYEPTETQYYQNQFGIEGIEESIFEINYKEAVGLIGHPPKIGSRIFTPHSGEHWRIVQPTRQEFALWGSIRLRLFCVKFQSDVVEGNITPKQPDFRINDLK